MKTSTAKLVSFGRGGDSVECSGGVRISGYGSPDSPHAADPGKDTLIIPDGTPAIDKRQAIETEEGYRHVFDGPMINVDLPDDEREDCPKPSLMFASAVAGNEYGGLLALHLAHRASSNAPGPLDFVPISEYVAGWLAVGARVGHYEQGVIVWHN